MSENKDADEKKEMLIEQSIPVRTIGIECEREGKGKFPPLNRFHIWWARRPLIAARTAVLSSVIGSDEMEIGELVERMGITGDTVEKYKTVDDRPKGQLVYEHYGYRRPFTQQTKKEDVEAIHEAARNTWGGELPTVFDMTAGGGAIPFESRRYELPTVANELNPVASVLLKAVLEHPTIGTDLSDDLQKWGAEINRIATGNLQEFYPGGSGGRNPVNYLWAHTINCPDCGLKVPLSPNWWLDKQSSEKGQAVKPYVEDGTVSFDVVKITPDEQEAENNEDTFTNSQYNPSDGTVSYGKGDCPQCGVTIDGDDIKTQAQQGEMGYQLFCVEYRNQRGSRGHFRSPTEEDEQIAAKAAEKIDSDPELAMLLTEERYIGPADRAANYGIDQWRDAYMPRQLLAHYEFWQAFEQVKEEIREEYEPEVADALLTLLAISADKSIDYNSRFSSWDSSTPKVRNGFDRHDFSFKWSFAETALIDETHGYLWFLNDVLEVYEELVEYMSHVDNDVPLSILNENAGDLSLEDESVDAIVVDPPYYDNVMYAELADFFYMWMKRYLDDVYPEFFATELTNKHDEAVANTAQFEDVAGAGQSKSGLAKDDYELKMSNIFSEASRVLSDDGILTLMFTHKKTDAWDTLTKALIEAGFTIHASHPINTESPRSLHQSGKNAARSTIFLVARKGETDRAPSLWSDVQRETRAAAYECAADLDSQEVEFSKVDMMLSAFGPTLEVFTKNYPVVDNEGETVSPQVALDEARDAVRDYLISNYLNEGVRDVDSKTEWYLLSWLIFEAERFPYDEARRLAIGVGEDLDELKKTNRMWRKRSGDVLLRPHSDRVQNINKKKSDRSSRKPVDPEAVSFATALDQVHAAMHIYDAQGAGKAWTWLEERNCDSNPAFKATLEALLRVQPRGHKEWELARDLAVGDTGEFLDLDLNASIFSEQEDEEELAQDTLSSYK